MKKEKKMVGPNQYKNLEVPQKVYGVYLGQNKTTKQGLLTAEEYAWQSNPAMNTYKYDDLVQSKFTKVPKANMKRDMVSRSPDRKKDNGPSPVSYPDKETKWQSLSQKPKVP